MKKVFLFFLLPALPAIASAQTIQEDSCRQFFTGEFTVAEQNFIKIKRTRRCQFETNTQEKIKTKYKIEWTDTCTYILTMVRTTDKKIRTRDQFGVPVLHTIINAGNNKYTYRAEYSFMTSDMCGSIREHVRKQETLIKIKADYCPL